MLLIGLEPGSGSGLDYVTSCKMPLVASSHSPISSSNSMLTNVRFGTPAFWLLDRIGRTTMLLLGFLPMFVLMLVLAFCFKTNQDGSARVPLVGVFGMLFIVAYSPTAGTSPFAISAEVFPLVVREVGHSIAVAVNFLGLGFVLLIFPSLSDAMGGYTASLSLFVSICFQQLL
jgi:nitrate/nitrite transporter NarK